MKKIALCGVGNGITDIIVQVDQKLFDSVGLKPGSMQLVSADDQKRLFELFGDRQLNLVSGGAVCNSTIVARQLGAEAGFICRLGDDRYGLHYQEELAALGITLPTPPIVRELSGTSVIMVTPDGERTMSTCLQASVDLAPGDIDEELVASAQWMFIEGYLLGNGESGQQAVRRAIEIARKHDTKIALTFSAGFIVDVFRDLVKELLPSIDLVFANHEEALTYTQAKSVEDSLAQIATEVPHVVVTAGSEGVFIFCNGERSHVPAYPCTPVDLTGAGDAFAGGYLYGLTHGFSVTESATGACYLAMKVITRIGARITSGTRDYWNEVVKR